MTGLVNLRSAGVMRTLGIAARPTQLFVVAYALNVTPHEAVHALTAYALGFNSTIYQMWVNPDAAAATPRQLAAIAASGPVFSLLLGGFCCLLYFSRFRRRPSGLILLMLAIVGVDCFLGPVAGAAFGGDFHTAFVSLGAPAWISTAVSAAGIILLPVFMFLMGRELSGWVPQQFGRISSILCTAAAPALVGTPLTLALYWPLPAVLIRSTLAGAAFWIFAAVGAAFGFERPRPEREFCAFTWVDATVLTAAIVMIRVFASGIRLTH